VSVPDTYFDSTGRSDRAQQFPQGRYLDRPNGSHLAMYDDQETYFRGLIEFLHELDGHPS